MRYLISSKWALTEHFTITDEAGTPAFEVRGNFGLVKHISFQDEAGAELALLKKHLMTNKYEIEVGGRPAAEVAHTGIFGEHYQVTSSQGMIDARGNFGGWDYTLSRGDGVIATVARQMAFREKFTVDIAAGENDVFVLATVLAIDNIHDERRQGGHEGLAGGIV